MGPWTIKYVVLMSVLVEEPWCNGVKSGVDETCHMKYKKMKIYLNETLLAYRQGDMAYEVWDRIHKGWLF